MPKTIPFTGNRWVNDDNFDIDHHLRHVALPRPGGIKELLTFISAQHSHLLDRSRPLWECYLIEGMQDGHFAIYTKLHPSMLDALGAIRMGMHMLSHDPENRVESPAFWQQPIPEAIKNRKKPSIFSKTIKSVTSAATQISTVRPVAMALYQSLREAMSKPENKGVFKAPRSILNDPITGSRRFAAQSFDTARLRSIARVSGSSMNDVLIATCGSAIRQYLLSLEKLPEQPLIAMVPIALPKDGSIGNAAAGVILANLGTHLSDPLQRLDTVKHSVRDAKSRFDKMDKEDAINYTALTLAPTAVSLLTGLMPQWLAFNVVISRVPSSRQSLYWNGARVERIYPVTPVANHMALNISILSYEDRMEVGIVGCRRTLPSMQKLLQYLEDGLVEIESALGVEAPADKVTLKNARIEPIDMDIEPGDVELENVSASTTIVEEAV